MAGIDILIPILIKHFSEHCWKISGHQWLRAAKWCQNLLNQFYYSRSSIVSRMHFNITKKERL